MGIDSLFLGNLNWPLVKLQLFSYFFTLEGLLLGLNCFLEWS